MANTCYMCPGSDSYFIWNTKTQLNSPWKILNLAGDTNAYEIPWSCCHYIEKYRPADLRKFEQYYFKSFRPQLRLVDRFPFGNYANVIGAAARQHNFTTIGSHKKPSLTLFKTYTYLMPTVFTKFRTLFLYPRINSLTYCRTKHLTKKTDVFSALFSPFDEITWGILLLLFISIYIIPGIRFMRAADIVWLFLGQPQQGKKFGLLIIALFIVLIPIPSSYTNYFTTNAVKPYETAFIDRNQELVDTGFKFLCYRWKPSQCFQKEYSEYFNVPMRKLTLDWTNLDKYFLQNRQSLSDAYRISVTRDKGMFPILRTLKEKTILLAERYTYDTECHMLSEYWHTVTELFFYTGALSDALYHTLGKLMEARFAHFWDSKAKHIEVKVVRKLTLRLDIEDTGEKDIVYMNSSIESLFKVFLVLHAFNILCFMLETLVYKCIAYRNRRKMYASYPKSFC